MTQLSNDSPDSSNLQSESPAEKSLSQLNRDSSTVDILINLQEQIESLQKDISERDKLIEKLNVARLLMFPSADDEPLFESKIKFVLADIAKESGGFEKICKMSDLLGKARMLYADFIEEYKSKNAIKIRVSQKDQFEKAQVDKYRKDVKNRLAPKRGPSKLTNEEKILRGLMKTFPSATQTWLLDTVMSSHPSADREKMKATIEVLMARRVEGKV